MNRRHLVAGTVAGAATLVTGTAAPAAPEKISVTQYVSVTKYVRDNADRFAGVSYTTHRIGEDGEILFSDMPHPGGDAVVIGYAWVFPTSDGPGYDHVSEMTVVPAEPMTSWVTHNFFGGGPGRLVRVYVI